MFLITVYFDVVSASASGTAQSSSTLSSPSTGKQACLISWSGVCMYVCTGTDTVSAVASTVSISSPPSTTAQSSSTLSSPPTGEHALSAGVYMLVHNVDVCTPDTDWVTIPVYGNNSQQDTFQLSVGISLGMDQSQLDSINMRRLACILLSAL